MDNVVGTFVALMREKLLTLPDHLSSFPVFLVGSALFIVVCLILFYLYIVFHVPSCSVSVEFAVCVDFSLYCQALRFSFASRFPDFPFGFLEFLKLYIIIIYITFNFFLKFHRNAEQLLKAL